MDSTQTWEHEIVLFGKDCFVTGCWRIRDVKMNLMRSGVNLTEGTVFKELFTMLPLAKLLFNRRQLLTIKYSLAFTRAINY